MSNENQSTTQTCSALYALCLSTVAYGIADRSHIKHNLEIIEQAIHAAVSMASTNMPVKANSMRPVARLYCSSSYLRQGCSGYTILDW
ncbi:MAG: hypothetical protein ACJAUG_001599 [Halioglobus sp.]|jgi:hypothetical protein